MPLFALYAKDKPEGGALRTAHRPAHLDNMNRLDDAGRLVFAGPLKDEAGERSIGSLIVFEAADLAAARKEIENDPYTQAGVFASWEILPTLKAFPKGK